MPNQIDPVMMTDDEVVKFIQTSEPLARARSKFRSWCSRIERTLTGTGPRNGPIMARRMEMQAVIDVVRTMAEHPDPPVDKDDAHYLMHFEPWFKELMHAVIVADLRHRHAHIYRDVTDDALGEIAGRRMDDKSRGASEDRMAAQETVYAILKLLRKKDMLRHGF